MGRVDLLGSKWEQTEIGPPPTETEGAKREEDGSWAESQGGRRRPTVCGEGWLQRSLCK